VVDATGGLARDAFLLACLGCRVTVVERCGALVQSVRDALRRAGEAHVERLREIVGRMTLVHADSRQWLAELPESERPEVVYVDPMYPMNSGSALAKKQMRILREFVGDDPDAGELLAMARSVARRRVVVKRHRYAPALAPNPSIQFRGNRVRYDVYLNAEPRPPALDGSP
jgi:16S rRNA (guanine1516-N2)-methyltransferase